MLLLNNAVKGLKIKPYAFVGLKHLERLDLTDNHLRQLPERGLKSSLNNMTLKELYLGGNNQWLCDCHLRWLKVWQVQRHRKKFKYKKIISQPQKTGSLIKREVEPICHGPKMVKEALLFSQENQITDFQCSPVVRTRPVTLRMRPGVNVTLSCAIFSDPKGLVLWSKDGTLVQNHWLRTHTSQSQGVEFRAELVIQNLRQSDAGEWVCQATNRRGVASTNFTIEVILSLIHI